MQPLIADGGELTVLRSLASHAWGRWEVEWPESVPEDQRPQLADDRERGFVAAMERQVGRMGRRFVRADVSITAAEYGPDGVMLPHSGVSNVEEQLDAAATRTEGDAFFEREITREGLGSLVPYEDFDVGDVVPVSIWGRVMEQPVMSIEAVSEAGAVVDWRVNVGGELLADDAARRRANEELERAIAQERRERVGDVGRVSAQASAAQSTAAAAQAGVLEVRETLAGERSEPSDLLSQLAAVNAQLQALGQEPQPSLMLSFMALATALFEEQRRIDATQDQLIRETQESVAAAKQEAAESAKRRAETILASVTGSSHPDFPVQASGGTWSLGGSLSAGDAVRVTRWAHSDDGTLSGGVSLQAIMPSAGPVPGTSGLGTDAFVEVLRMSTPLVVRRFSASLPQAITVDSGGIAVPGLAVTVEKGSRAFDVSARVRYSSGWGWYVLQIVRSDGTVLAERRDEGRSNIFTRHPLEQQLTVRAATIPAGQTVTVRVVPGKHRDLVSASWSGSWTEKQ